MWLNRSLKYGFIIFPYWPMKFWWASRKVIYININQNQYQLFLIQTIKMAMFQDFPEAPEGHPDAGITRSYLLGGRDPKI